MFNRILVAMKLRIDIIVFGASGYSGKRLLRRLPQILIKEKRQITWGIAGRNAQKLKDVINELNLGEVPVMVADSKNPASLEKMASSCRLLINCTGPYKELGEPVVRACISQNCHYIDLSAEPLFMERIRLNLGSKAEEKNVYVVPACGMDSILADLGLDFLKKKFQGTLNSVETYLEVTPEDGKLSSGPMATAATWQSFLINLVEKKELKEIRNKHGLKLAPKLALKSLPHKVPRSNVLSVPYPGPDHEVMRRSQLYFFEKTKSRPVQVRSYIILPTLYTFLVVLFFPILLFLTKFEFCTNILMRFSKIFSAGFCGEAPKEEETKKFKVVTTLYGRGWKGKIVDENYSQVEDGWMTVKVQGHDAYEITAVCASVAALVLLNGSENLPEVGGVYTPAPFFANTSLVEILGRNGINFRVCEEGDL